MLHWTGEECLRSSSGYHLHTHPGYKNVYISFFLLRNVEFCITNETSYYSDFHFVYFLFFLSNPNYFEAHSTLIYTHLNLSSLIDQCPIFEPGDMCRRWTFSRHTLEENSSSLSHCLIPGTVENIFQTWNIGCKIGCPLVNLEDDDGNIHLDWARFYFQIER